MYFEVGGGCVNLATRCIFDMLLEIEHLAPMTHSCVAVCCSVLQCVAVWCSVLQCVADTSSRKCVTPYISIGA